MQPRGAGKKVDSLVQGQHLTLILYPERILENWSSLQTSGR